MQLSKVVIALAAAVSVQACDNSSSSHAAAVTKSYCPPRAASPAEQTAIFNAFIRTVYIERNVSAAFNTYVAEDYIQHNPSAQSGRQNAIDALSPFVPSVNYTIQRITVADSLAWSHVKAEIPGQPVAAVVDIFRMNGSCVQEHWDVFQFVPANSSNPIAMF